MASASTPRRWPLWLAPLSAIVLPTATVRRTEHMRLWQAAIIHVFGLVLVAAVYLLAIAWFVPAPVENVSGWWANFMALLAILPQRLMQVRILLPLGGVLLFIEAVTIVMAWLLMAWGARDEMVPTAFLRSLRRLWCVTPHAALVLLLLGLVAIPLGHAHAQAWQQWQLYPPPAVLAEWDQREAFLSVQPWYIRHCAAVNFGTALAGDDMGRCLAAACGEGPPMELRAVAGRRCARHAGIRCWVWIVGGRVRSVARHWRIRWASMRGRAWRGGMAGR